MIRMPCPCRLCLATQLMRTKYTPRGHRLFTVNLDPFRIQTDGAAVRITSAKKTRKKKRTQGGSLRWKTPQDDRRSMNTKDRKTLRDDRRIVNAEDRKTLFSTQRRREAQRLEVERRACTKAPGENRMPMKVESSSFGTRQPAMFQERRG
ncbi:hypothetical protein NDU88_007388 [Pleurodeles waltl]|uniref:Uncharacterized protein n=1 Tax=Pleurodeles waltl TaxID=8319 RepID=A0AAV7SSL7_PLEWA|nr:hypothetical protein NDU88_007388 [Pleurodeles waltl]